MFVRTFAHPLLSGPEHASEQTGEESTYSEGAGAQAQTFLQIVSCPCKSVHRWEGDIAGQFAKSQSFAFQESGAIRFWNLLKFL